VGGRYSDEWHRIHLNNPRDLVPESNMPAYPWLNTAMVPADAMTQHVKGMQQLGVPYTDEDVANARADVEGKTEMDALVAYLQVMGTSFK